jgi:biotin carboxylase
MILQNQTTTLADGGPQLPPEFVGRFPTGSHALDGLGRPRHLLMLGGSLLQLPAIRMAKEEGWSVILADGNPEALARPWVDHFEHVDLKDAEGMLAMARRYHAGGRLHGVFTAGTDFSATVAFVAESLGLPGIPHEAALNASSKLRMRRIFRERGIPSPAFVELEPGREPTESELAGLRLPVVVKPIDNMGARGVRRLDAWHGLATALADARGHSRRGTVLIEEFIEGPEYSIDSLVVDGRLVPCGLALRHVRFPPYFVEVGHTIPSDLTDRQVEELVAVFGRAVAALGITTGAAKGDVFMTSSGPMIGEIAARLSGGYMSGWTFPLASGLEVTRAALYQAMGLPLPSLDQPRHQVCAERALISIPGRVRGVEGLEAALLPDAVTHYFSRVQPGSRVVFPRNNVEKAGNILAVADNRRAAMDAAETAVSRCLIRLEPDETDTESWLFRPKAGQWPAYPGLLSLLPLAPDPAEARSHVAAFPAIMAERDWSWRSLADSLAWLDAAGWQGTAGRLSGPGGADLGQRFWTALAWGGLQGALYALDCRSAGGMV